jgi:16S rRNA (cytidine1402-2'-O)-methyltransferase
MTYRAVETLKAVTLIAAEDTRITKRLLDHYSIPTPLLPYHDHNKEQVTPKFLDRLQNGENIALVTDAGTPMVSDPGFYLVRASIREGINVCPIPGASALLAGVVAAGLPTDRFTFEGFLPRKKGRQTRLRELAEDKRTIVLYESPHRIARTVRDLYDAMGDRPVTIGRELTKRYEEFIRGSLGEIREQLANRTVKGEVVIIVGGKS